MSTATEKTITAHLTDKALTFSHSFHGFLVNKDYERTDVLIAQVFCHWDVLFGELMNTLAAERDYHQIGQDCIDLFSILGECFAKYIRDRYNILGKSGKHAVWFDDIAANCRFTCFGSI
jgi:hypothetical protein